MLPDVLTFYQCMDLHKRSAKAVIRDLSRFEYLLPDQQSHLIFMVARCDYLYEASAVHSHSPIYTVRSFTQYNLSSILQLFLHMRGSTSLQHDHEQLLPVRFVRTFLGHS